MQLVGRARRLPCTVPSHSDIVLTAHRATCDATSRQRDLILQPAAWGFWYVPTLAWAVAWAWPAGRAWVWAAAFAVMGAGCTLNALRCRRLHCHLTAPLFWLAAAWCALAALGVVALRPWATSLIVAALFAAAWLAETPFGRYRKT